MVMKTEVKDKVVNWLTQNPFVYSVLTSKPVHKLLEIGVSRYVYSLRDPQSPETINPSNKTLLKKVSVLERIGQFVLPNKQERVFEPKITGVIGSDLKTAIAKETDTNSTLKLRRTLGLMGEKYLNKVLLDFAVVNFGLGTLKERFLVQEDQPAFHYLALQVNSECNARPRCLGCFAEQDTNKLSAETLDRVQGEAISLGSRFTIIIGGEPLLEKKVLLDLFKRYNGMPFFVATNGILVDDAYAEEIADLDNVFTFINIPGLEATTNTIRRNPNAWRNIQRAAGNLKKYGAASGFASTVYQTNYREVSSGEFVQQMIDFNMMLGFYFGYTDPLGCAPKTELALTSEMNEEFSQRVEDASAKYPMYLVDTSGGREKIIGGCPAGRNFLLYVHSDGRVAGCPMAPQTDASINVNNLPLSTILKTPYFERIRQERPSCLRSPRFWSNLQRE